MLDNRQGPVDRFDNVEVFAKVVESSSLASAAARCYQCFDGVSKAALLPDRAVIKSALRRSNRSSPHSPASATGGSYHRGTLRSSVSGS